MSNRRVKALTYEDDGYDYDEDRDEAADDGLTDQDRDQLRLGTIKIREVLGPEFPTTDDEIQEALWHYYYDVEKSVTYLKNKQTPKTTRKAKNKASAVCTSLDTFSVRDFFRDSPWLNVPEERQANILIEPLYPRYGLLGGSESKKSKLAALAAKRRQKENVKPTQPVTDAPRSAQETSATLEKLHISEPENTQVRARSLASSAALAPVPPSPKRHTTGEGQLSSSSDQQPQFSPSSTEIRGTPSRFAETMLEPRPGAGQTAPLTLPLLGLVTKAYDFAEPSPDDIIAKAQTPKASTTTKKTDTRTPNSAKKDVSTGLKDLSLQESLIPRTKNLDVVAEYKKVKRKNAANFVVIGHVDAGKSTLMGRLLFDLKAIDQRTMDRYQKEAEAIGKGSFAFAWVLDQGSEERARGITIDIAQNKFETNRTSFTILDAPGHRDFVPNMIAGASQADFAVLVVDASTGNFESGLKGQTKEHALLVRSIGVQRIIVAVNKMDMAQWSRDRFDEIQGQMSGFLTTAGFQSKNIAFVPCSGLEGGNILTHTTEPQASWYSGKTLVEELDAAEPSTHAIDRPLRMTINDVFRGSVQNPLSISGRIEAGNVQVGEQIITTPSTERASIKSLQVDDEPRDWAVAGENVVMNLSDIDPIHLKTGDMVCSSTSPIQNIQTFTAKILAFEHLTPMTVDVHRGRLHVPGRISQLIAALDKASGVPVKKKPKIVQPGSVVRVQVELDQAVPLEPPNRIVLRSGGETVAAGLVE